jgi:Tfp pilus assembly protein PilO
MAPPLWSRVRWTARRWLRRIGLPGMLAIGISAMCFALYFSAIRPEQARLDSVRHSAVTLHEKLTLTGKSSSGAKLSPEDQLAEFYGKFPQEGCSPQWLEKLVALAATRGLTLNDGEYKATREKVGKLVRYQMILPVKGEYPQIRKFLTDVPGALPVIALENVQFERQKVADPSVEAKIKLVLYLEQSS